MVNSQTTSDSRLQISPVLESTASVQDLSHSDKRPLLRPAVFDISTKPLSNFVFHIEGAYKTTPLLKFAIYLGKIIRKSRRD